MNPSHLLSEQSDLREEKEGKGINKWFCSRCWCCYLAIPQDRRTRSSGSPLTPGTLPRACRVWSCRGPSAFHSSHLQGATSTNKTRFVWYFGAESQAWKQLRPNRHRHIFQPKLSDDFFIFIFFAQPVSQPANQPGISSHSRPVQTFPYLFPQHMAPKGSCLQFPTIVQSFAVLWEQEAGKQEMCQVPRSHPGAGKRAFHYPKSCGFFRKDDSTNTRQFGPRRSVVSCFVK